jgi:hypothetical protein
MYTSYLIALTPVIEAFLKRLCCFEFQHNVWHRSVRPREGTLIYIDAMFFLHSKILRLWSGRGMLRGRSQASAPPVQRRSGGTQPLLGWYCVGGTVQTGTAVTSMQPVNERTYLR